jgi:hypothetical protein
MSTGKINTRPFARPIRPEDLVSRNPSGSRQDPVGPTCAVRTHEAFSDGAWARFVVASEREEAASAAS